MKNKSVIALMLALSLVFTSVCPVLASESTALETESESEAADTEEEEDSVTDNSEEDAEDAAASEEGNAASEDESVSAEETVSEDESTSDEAGAEGTASDGGAEEDKSEESIQTEEPAEGEYSAPAGSNGMTSPEEEEDTRNADESQAADSQAEETEDAAVPAFTGSISLVLDGQTVIPDESGESDPEALFSDYVDNAFGMAGSSSRKRARKSAGSRLTGIEAEIYSNIAGCLPDIASGLRASTIFEIQPDQLGLEKTFWTAEELGVASILEEDANGEYYISDDAIDALSEKVDYNLSTIITCLLADFPYQLYWYDKTQGSDGSGFGLSVSYNDAAEDYVLELDGNITIRFPVADEFSAGSFMVDTSVGQSVQTAVSTARKIVETHSGEDDYTKLCAFKDEICALVSYNDEAAEQDISYGNPWQMIWVFDGDPETNVVCEGYSKAFKYLCDQSSFSGNITCITASGMMGGGTGEGPHMWNILKMGDGRNYLVDVTNCDEETIGEPDQLFLCGYSEYSENTYYFSASDELISYVYSSSTLSIFDSSDLEICDHNYDPDHPGPIETEIENIVLNGQTSALLECTYENSLEVTYDGNVLFDEHRNTIENNEGVTLQIGFMPQSGGTETVDFADSLTGFVIKRYNITIEPVVESCSGCKGQVIEHTVRTYGAAADCPAVDGLSIVSEVISVTNYDPFGFEQSSDYYDNKLKIQGEEAGDYQILLGGSENPFYILDCHVAEHDFVEDSVQEASCTEEGIRNLVCANCGKTDSEVIPAKGHTWEKDYTVDTQATCTKEGSESIHCSVCDAIKEGSSRKIAKTAHKYGKWTTTKEAACTETGSKQRTCTACGHKETASIPALGHDWTEWEVVTEQTAESEGLEKRSCTRCDAEETRVIEIPAGWVEDSRGMRYRGSDGTYSTSKFEEIDGHKFYFDADGYMTTGWKKIENTWYYFGENGVMSTGWNKVGSTWYYFAANGAMTTGWKKIGSTWYYFASSGAMATGWQKIGSTWYYFASGGAMATGWKKIGTAWYYFDTSGAMASGWKKIGSTWYYFAAGGAMTTGWKKIGTTWYYFSSGGAMATGWQKLGGSWYYFGTNGKMVTGRQYIGGKWYTFNSSGVMQ